MQPPNTQSLDLYQQSTYAGEAVAHMAPSATSNTGAQAVPPLNGSAPPHQSALDDDVDPLFDPGFFAQLPSITPEEWLMLEPRESSSPSSQPNGRRFCHRNA